MGILLMIELRETVVEVVLKTSRLLVLGNFNIRTEAALTGTAEKPTASVAFILELSQGEVCTLVLFLI